MDSAADKDLPLKDDTRLLGRVLGDVLRDETGADGFDRVEAIRRTAVRFRRAGAADADGVRAELAALLNPLPIAQTLDVVRAFSYFSHLANIAEDVHQNRRRRAHALAGSPPQRGSLADALARIRGEGVDAAAVAGLARRRGGVAGADGAPDRGAAQEHPRRRAHHRPAARPARPDGARARRGRGGRDRAAPQRPAAVADGDDPARAARGEGRDRQRARLLRLHVPRRGSAALRDARRAAAGRVRARSRMAAAAVLPHGLVDRRRPRRQPVRHCADARLRGPRAGDGGVRTLPRRGPRARRRAVAVDPAGAADGGAARTGRGSGRRQPASRRTSPTARR